MINRAQRSCVAVLSVAALLASCGAAFAGGNASNPETESNETKVTATVASSGGAGLNSGDVIVGNSTGFSTLPGASSLDTFRVKTAAATPGIYRHRLVITSPIAGHTGTIRGLGQTGGNIATGTDVAFQTSATTTTPARFNQWYGFGRQEEVYYRVTGTPATTADYTSTLTTDVVAPVAVQTPLAAGTITITRNSAGGNTNDVDMWLYDSTFTPVPAGGNDGQDTLTRTLASGTYFLAISNFNLANNQSSPADDSFRGGSVLDFPNAVCNTSQVSGLNMGVTITDSSGTITAAATKAGPYDVVWYQLTVGNSNPSGSGVATPATVPQGTSTLLTVSVTPGANPTSTGITVSVNAAAIGGSTVTLTDDGQSGDSVAGDGVYSSLVSVSGAAPLGSASLPFTVTDAQQRSGGGIILLSVTLPPPANDQCVNALTVQLPSAPIIGTTDNTTVAGFDATGTCGGATDTRDVYYQFTATTTGFYTVDTCSTPGLDSVVSIHSACPLSGAPNLVAAETCQDSTCGAGNGGARVFAFLSGGTTYILRVASKGTVTGSFTLVITEPAPSLPNDECAGAIAISTTEIPFNNGGATTSSGSTPAGCTGAIAADVWFGWTPPQVVGNGQWQVRCTSTASRLALWSGPQCPQQGDSPLLCLESGASGLFNAGPDQQFLVQVGGSSVTPLLGDASVLFSFIPITGRCCTGGTLAIKSESDCLSGGGIYGGDNTSGGVTGAGLVRAGGQDRAIPDNNLTALVDTINVSGADTIRNLLVNLELEHTFAGDLSATLSNGSIAVELFDRVGRGGTGLGSSADFVAGNVLRFYDTAGGDLWAAAGGTSIAAGDYRPTAGSNVPTHLADFVGGTVAGAWTLTLRDNSLGDTGRLVSWSLEFNPTTVCPGPCLADFNQDGNVNADDLGDFITCFFSTPPCPQAEFNNDGDINADDLGDFITTFFSGCP